MARAVATTSSCRLTRTPRRTASTTSSPTSTRRTGRRSPPSGTCPRWPSPCSAASIPARSTSPIRSGRPPAGAWPAWGSTPTRPRDWLAHYGTDWVTLRRRRAPAGQVLEEQGIHAEVALPGPDPGRRTVAGDVPRRDDRQGARGGVARPPRLHRWLAEFCAAAPGRRAGCIPIDFHDMDRAVAGDRRGPVPTGIFGGVMLPAMSVRSGLPGYADEYYEPFWSACEEHGMVVNLHTGASGSATDTSTSTTRARRLARALRGVRLHPPPAVVHDLRWCVRSPSEPQGGGHRERRPVAAVPDPGHGVLLRHPRRSAGPLLSADAPGGVLRDATSFWAGR